MHDFTGVIGCWKGKGEIGKCTKCLCYTRLGLYDLIGVFGSLFVPSKVHRSCLVPIEERLFMVMEDKTLSLE